MTWAWTAWLLVIAVSFAVLEGYALRSGRTTLSRYVVSASRAWPLLPFVLGLIIGVLANHFFWPWCPDLGIGNG